MALKARKAAKWPRTFYMVLTVLYIVGFGIYKRVLLIVYHNFFPPLNRTNFTFVRNIHLLHCKLHYLKIWFWSGTLLKLENYQHNSIYYLRERWMSPRQAFFLVEPLILLNWMKLYFWNCRMFLVAAAAFRAHFLLYNKNIRFDFDDELKIQRRHIR